MPIRVESSLPPLLSLCCCCSSSSFSCSLATIPGVRFHYAPTSKPWEAFDADETGQVQSIGYFRTSKAAALARDRFLMQHQEKDPAPVLNFPDLDDESSCGEGGCDGEEGDEVISIFSEGSCHPESVAHRSEDELEEEEKEEGWGVTKARIQPRTIPGMHGLASAPPLPHPLVRLRGCFSLSFSWGCISTSPSASYPSQLAAVPTFAHQHSTAATPPLLSPRACHGSKATVEVYAVLSLFPHPSLYPVFPPRRPLPLWPLQVPLGGLHHGDGWGHAAYGARGLLQDPEPSYARICQHDCRGASGGFREHKGKGGGENAQAVPLGRG